MSHFTLPEQFWHNMMSEWMLCKESYWVFKGGENKRLLILPNHTGCLCEPRKVEFEGNPHSPLKRMGRDPLSLHGLSDYRQDKTG